MLQLGDTQARVAALPYGLEIFTGNFGDSLTFLAGDVGWRRRQFDWQATSRRNVVRVGTLNDGTFPNPFHQGTPNDQIADCMADFNANYGPANTFKRVDIGHVLWATNDVRQPGANAVTIANNSLTSLLRISEVFPRIVLINSTIPPIDPTAEPAEAVIGDAFNALLPEVWAAYNAVREIPIVPWDAHGVIPDWTPAFFLDAYHWNNAAYLLLNPFYDIAWNTAVSYLRTR